MESGPVIKRMLGGRKEAKDPPPGCWTLYFDGGCREKRGSGGYVLFDADGNQVEAAGLWFPEEARTNNEAELAALAAGMGYLGANRAELLA